MFDSLNFPPQPFPPTFGSMETRRRYRHPHGFSPEWGRKGRRRGHPFEKRREGQHRFPRGEIKYILLSLIAEQSQHGYQLIKELESRWGGFYRPSPGSVYPTLQLLEEGGYLTSEQTEGKKVYTITESGRELLSEHQQSFETLNQLDEQPQLIELRKTLRDLREIIMQVTRSGNQERINKVLTRLKQLKRDIYLMLAEDD
ncbi:MAG: PadR family transcriptional regulator [Cyanobacteria bacterium P01_G01_bin.49]